MKKLSCKTIIKLSAAALVLIVIAAIYAWSNMGNGATSINNTTSRAVSRAPYQKLATDYLEFEHRSTYEPVKETQTGGALEMYSLTADTIYTKTMTEAVFAGDYRSSSSFAPYLTRKVQPAVYAMTETTVAGEPATIFTKQDGSEVTVFMYHAGNSVSLSLATSDPASDNLSQEVTALLPTVSWKQ